MAVIRNVVVRIAADVSDLQKSLQDAQGIMQGVGSKLASVGAGLTASITTPIAGIGIAAIKTAADFEAGMSSIKAVSGATGDEMEQLKKLALQMGADTKYSAGEAAKGIEELIKAGVSVKDILNGGLKGALSLAAAGEIELADAAEIASTALNSFKADNLSVGKAADILAGAANASATDVGELKYALSSVSAVASSVGMSFEDTTTALAVFAQNGLKGSDAGTSLKTMLMNLQPQTDKQAALFKQLGLVTSEGNSIFFNTQGHLKSLSDIAGILQNSMGGLTDAQRLQAMETIFGSDAIRASNILFKEGALGVSEMKTAMSNVTAEEVAAERLNNFNGALEQLKGSVETVLITIGTVFLPTLKNLADFLTELTNKFLTLDPAIQQVIIIVAAVAAAIGPALIVIGAMSSGLGVLAGALSFLISPVGLVIAAIVALAAIFIYLWNTNDQFRVAVTEIWNQIQTVLLTIWQTIQQAAMIVFGALLTFWEQNGQSILNAITLAWGTIMSYLKMVWTVIQTVATALFGALFDFFKAHGEEIKNALVTAWTVIWQIIEPIWNTINQMAQFIFGSIQTFFQTWGPTIQEIFRNTFELVYQVAMVIFNQLKVFWDTWGPLIIALFQYTLGVIKVVFETVWNLIVNVVETVVGVISNIIKFFLAVFKGDWEGAWNAIKGIFEAVWNGIKGVFQIVIDAFIKLFNNFKDNIGAIWDGLWYGIKKVAETVWNAIKGVIQGAIDGIVGIFTAFKNVVVGIWDAIWSGIKGFINFIIKGINFMINALNALHFDVPDWIPVIGGKSFGFNIPNIPYLADGGIVTGPTLAMIGEAGPEAVVPLEKMGDMGAGNQPIIIYLDGKMIYKGVDNYLGSRLVGLGAV